jgi:transcriptional regulator with GAF, ATPase, and Fis domain
MQSKSACVGEDRFLSVDDLLRQSQRLFLAFNQGSANGLAREVTCLLSELRQHEFEFAALALQHPENKTVAVLSQPAASPNFHNTLISSAFRGLAAGLHQAIEVHDAGSESKFRDLAQLMKTGGFHSFRIVPVSTQRHTHGALIVGRDKPGEFAVEQVTRSSETARRVALMLENSLVTDLVFDQRERLGTVFEVNTALAATVDIRGIFEQVSSTVRRVLPNHYTCLAIYDKPADAMNIRFLDSENRPVASLSDPAVPLTECPAGIAHRQRAAMLFNHSDLQLFNSQHSRNLLAEGIHSLCHLPLISRNKNLGTLAVAGLTDDAVCEDDVVLLTQIASQMALAVDNVRAHEEIARYKDRFSK